MTINLSQHAGGGNTKYVPGMMTFNGTDGTYYDTSQTISGNVFTVVGRFVVSSQTSAQEFMRIREVGGTGKHRLAITIQPSNHATPDVQNKMEILVQDNTAATAVRLPSLATVADGAEHTFFFSWDYATATYVFKIDGVDAANTGSARYVAPTILTAATGSTFYISIGSVANSGSWLNGDIGYIGYGEVIGTWSDFFKSDGSPKELNETTWVEWGSTQPLYWNQYGMLTDNKGSAGNMTAYGTITPAFVNTFTLPILGLNTVGTVTEDEVVVGESCWVDGVEVIGKAGGGEIFTPWMTEFEGSEYYSDGTLTTSGNKVTVVARFKCDPDTNLRGIFGAHDSSWANRAVLFVSTSDAADNANQLYALCSDGTNTTLCRIYSEIEVADGKHHTVFFEFDADNGTAVLVVDGTHQDDLTAPSRVAPTVGTLAGGSSSKVAVGAFRFDGTYPFVGHINFIGYDDVGGLDPFDFMDTRGNIKPIDETTWTEWGSQPLLWNRYGDMASNLGSNGALAKTGTPAQGTGGETGYAPFGANTDGDAVASDILTDKVAWVNGERLVGTGSAGPTYNNAVVLWEIGAGASGAYTPVIGDLEYAKAGVSLNTVPTFNRDGNGWCQPTSGTRLLIDLPAKSTTRRRFIYQGRTVTGHTTNSRLHVFTNYTDSTHNWYHRLIWNPGWALSLYEVNGTEALRGSGSIDNNLDDLIHFTYVVEDWGDTVFFSIQACEDVVSSISDIGAGRCAYRVASRYNKTVETCGLQWINYTGDFELSSIEIYDVPD